MRALRMRHQAFPDGVSRDDLLQWYRAVRSRSRELFALIRPEAYYERPISLRNPIVFYEGHLPAFAVNTLIRSGLGEAGVDRDLEVLFARGIDPEDEASAKSPTDLWPAREQVQAYGREADLLIENALGNASIDDDRRPLLCGGEAVFTILEHEQMHHETLLYMFHNLPTEWKVAPATSPHHSTARQPLRERIRIPRGTATLGKPKQSSFGWDNEFPETGVEVDAFEIDADNVTNGDFLQFVEATGAAPPHFWVRSNGSWLRRELFGDAPLPLDAPVYATHDQAEAYATWKGSRLPSEAEYHRAAYGTPEGHERLHPWGNELPDETRGNFDFATWDPLPVGSFPSGDSAWGVRDLVGNGWEWTSSVFAGFDGFKPMPSYPEYSADFFDGAHFVMKGASPATERHLLRRSFRNWFRPNYPYVYATFRCVGSVSQ